MAFEVELKARLQNPAAIESAARQLGSFKYETFKEDVYFRRKGDANKIPTDRYRLRRMPGQLVVTYKQKIRADGTEVNDETEFEVDNAHAFFKFTDRFGFEPFVVKRKKSRVYQVERADVELNEVEHLGHFIEIEILCHKESEVPFARTELARLYNQLALTPADLEPRFYIDMLQEAYPARYRFVDNATLDWPFEEVLER
jgi:predicted adenylyl cyclase CyaB